LWNRKGLKQPYRPKGLMLAMLTHFTVPNKTFNRGGMPGQTKLAEIRVRVFRYPKCPPEGEEWPSAKTAGNSDEVGLKRTHPLCI